MHTNPPALVMRLPKSPPPPKIPTTSSQNYAGGIVARGGGLTSLGRLLRVSLRLELWHRTVRKMEVEGRWIKEHWERRGIQPAHYRSGKEWRKEFLSTRGKQWDSDKQMVVLK